MTRLQAPDAARIALQWRKIEDRAKVVQGRVEALPKAYQDGPMRAAWNRIGLRHKSKAVEALDAIDDALDRHQSELAASDMARAGEEQNRLLADRGIETFDAGTVKARDGWQWLITRKPARLTAEEIATGNDWVKMFALAQRDELSSSSNDNGGAGGLEDPLEARIKNRTRLDAVRRHIDDATGSKKLSGLLDAVCGRGDTLRALAGNDDRKADRYEAELKIALAMAQVGIRSVKKAEDEAKRRAA